LNSSFHRQNNELAPFGTKTAMHGIQIQLLGVAVVLLIIFAIVLTLTLVINNINRKT
jgi:hypothetical protein